MSEFRDAMLTTLEEFRNTQNAEPDTAKKTRKAPKITFQCEGSGIDMVVTRMTNEKPTKIMYIYLSEVGDDGMGTILIKKVKEGKIEKADEDSVFAFFQGLQTEQRTGLDAMPYIRHTRNFANNLMEAREQRFTILLKKGLLTIDTVRKGDSYCTPSYAEFNRFLYGTVGVFSPKDFHPKLIRYMLTRLTELNGHCTYGEMFSRLCNDYSNNGKAGSVWAFITLADMFDEDFAKKCFEEYMDTDRLAELNQYQFQKLLRTCNDPEDLTYYRRTNDSNLYLEDVEQFRTQPYIRLDKNRLWEYILHAISVGKGCNLDNYLSMYSDYLSLAYRCDKEVKDKYPEYLQVAHDIYSEKFTRMRTFEQVDALLQHAKKGASVIDQEHDGYELRTLSTIEEFLEEARQNSNCVASYADKVAKGRCWVASFRPKGATSTLLTVEIDLAYNMVQVKGKCNREPKEKETEILDKFKQVLRARAEAQQLEQEA